MYIPALLQFSMPGRLKPISTRSNLCARFDSVKVFLRMRVFRPLLLTVALSSTVLSTNSHSQEIVSLQDWGSGFIANYTYTITDADAPDGWLREWSIDLAGEQGLDISSVWITSGYSAGANLSSQWNTATFTNDNAGYISELNPGDTIDFSVQGSGLGFDAADLAVTFYSQTAATSTDVIDTPVVVETPAVECVQLTSFPLVHNGAGDLCWTFYGTIDTINSWGADSVTVEGVDHTNRWVRPVATNPDGITTILYSATQPWAHIDVWGHIIEHEVDALPPIPDPISVVISDNGIIDFGQINLSGGVRTESITITNNGTTSFINTRTGPIGSGDLSGRFTESFDRPGLCRPVIGAGVAVELAAGESCELEIQIDTTTALAPDDDGRDFNIRIPVLLEDVLGNQVAPDIFITGTVCFTACL